MTYWWWYNRAHRDGLATVTGVRASTDWLSRVQALLGVGPLAVYLAYHLWQQWPALRGRELWVDRARATDWGWMPWLLVIALGAHAALGVIRLRRASAVTIPGPNRGSTMRRIQAATGAVALLFVLYHLGQVALLGEGPHRSQRDAYAALWQALGRPLDTTVYLAGLAALCFHLAHGLPRALVTLGLVRDVSAFRVTRYVAGLLGLLLWLGYLQVLSHFAIGEGLLPRWEGHDAVVVPAED